MDGKPLSRSIFLKHFGKGFVKEGVTFVISDDLIVKPNSVEFTGLSMLQNYGIKDISSVKEMTLNVTKEKVIFYSCVRLFVACFTIHRFLNFVINSFLKY